MDSNAILLSPAGDFERLEMALHYGADAVYLAGEKFGMRAFAGNFSRDALKRAMELAHGMGRKIYVTCNTLPRDNELPLLPEYLSFLQEIGTDALIVADFGVMGLCGKHAPKVPLHVSTQFGVVNSESARMLHELGADCVVLARELSLDEIAAIRANTPAALRLEAFIHGAMCISFSGRCVLSNYMTGRDANRGECAQPCRWKYTLMEEKRPGEYFPIVEGDEGAYILNSRDLCMIDHLSELLRAGVDILKIEGRMKSAYYTAVVTNAYRHALDAAYHGQPVDDVYRNEVNKLRHREYCTGFYFGEPGQHTESSAYYQDAMVCAVVESCDADGNAVLSQRNRITSGETLELLCRDCPPIRFRAEELRDPDGMPLSEVTRPMMRFSLRLPIPAPRLSILRKPI